MHQTGRPATPEYNITKTLHTDTLLLIISSPQIVIFAYFSIITVFSVHNKTKQ